MNSPIHEQIVLKQISQVDDAFVWPHWLQLVQSSYYLSTCVSRRWVLRTVFPMNPLFRSLEVPRWFDTIVEIRLHTMSIIRHQTLIIATICMPEQWAATKLQATNLLYAKILELGVRGHIGCPTSAEAPGSDPITAHILKKASKKLRVYNTYVINVILRIHHVPKQWKKA